MPPNRSTWVAAWLKLVCMPRLDRLVRANLWERLDHQLRRLGCRLLGHKKPYIEKLSARLCRRCHIVIETRSPYRLVLPLAAPWPTPAPPDPASTDPPAAPPPITRKPENP